MEKMKISLVTTVLNEEKTIDQFLDSVANQSLLPDEVIIVDGGSVDWTVEKIQRKKIKDLNLKIIIEHGANRAKGRNEGVKNATGEIIAFTDAGCILDKDWLREITKPFSDPKINVVAGYYRGLAKNVFEKCVIPYALVMPDKINPQNFYPASRSMAIRRQTFLELGGFPEEFSDNEDYVFAHKISQKGIKSYFVNSAIVNWLPRSNLKSFYNMIFRFARGDAKAGLRKNKIISIFGRYVIFLLLLSFSFKNPISQKLLLFLILTYLLWSVFKNYRYVKQPEAFFLLPILQICSDLAFIMGTIAGFKQRFFSKN